MSPKNKKSPRKESKRNKKIVNLASKLKFLDLLQTGEKVAAIARRFEINELTVRLIRDKEETIRKSSSNLEQLYAKFVKVVRQNHVEKMEEMISIWI